MSKHLTGSLALVFGLGACMMPPPEGSQSPGAGQPSAGEPGASEPGMTDPAMGGEASGPAAAEPAGPSVVSVSIKNECPETVKIFFGDKPKFGSGRYSTLGSNTRTSESFKPGDMFWIVDESQNGVASVTVGDSTRDIVIEKSCTTLAAR